MGAKPSRVRERSQSSNFVRAIEITTEVCFGGAPNPARETRALPGESLADVVELHAALALNLNNVARF